MKRKRARKIKERAAVEMRRLSRLPIAEITTRMGVALRFALRGGAVTGKELARDGFLCAGARLWWYRSERRAGNAERDLLDDLNRAWADIATGPHDDAWYKARLEASAFYLVACGLPPELIPAVTEMAEPGLKAHNE